MATTASRAAAARRTPVVSDTGSTLIGVAVFCMLLSGVNGLVRASDEADLRLHLPAADVDVLIVVTPADPPGAPVERRVERDTRVARLGPFDPGDYDVRVTTSDQREQRLRMTLRAGFTSVYEVRIPAGDAALTLVRIEDVAEGQAARFDARALRDLPSAGDLWSLIETAAPFVITDRAGIGRLDTGGVGLGAAALMGSRGESWALTSVSFGGLPVRLPTRTGLLPVLPDMNAAAAVAVRSGLAPVEVDTPGVQLDWTPRLPSTKWSGGGDLSFTTPAMVGENRLPHAPSIGAIADWRHAALFAGGPIAGDAGLFVSTAFSRATSAERAASALFTSETRSVLVHVAASRSPASQVRLLAGMEQGESPWDERHQFADPARSERTTFGRGQLTWDRATASGGVIALALGLQRASWRPQAEPGAAGATIDRVRHGIVPPAPSDLRRTQWDGRASWRSSSIRLGPVAAEGRAGATLRLTADRRDVIAQPTVAESVAALPARVWMPAPMAAVSNRRLTEVGVFAAERFLLGPRFTVDAGVRVDMARGRNGGSVPLTSTTASPRVSFRWSPAAMSIFGGVGRYAGGHPLSWLAFGDPGESTWDVRRWTDPNGSGRFEPGEAGALVARAGSGLGVGSLDPDLRVPRTTEWVIGAEFRPTSSSVLRGSIVIRRQTDLVGVVNTGVSADDYRVSFVPDINADEGSPADDQLLPVYERLPSSFGRDALLLTNPPADAIAHDGIEVSYEISSPRWFMLFGATAYRTLGRGGLLGHGVLENDPLVPGDRFWNPNAIKDDAGRLFFDRAYVGKWTTAYRAPGDVRLAAVVRYQDGQPFTRFVVAADLAGGPEITHAYPVGRTRFTYTATVDARIEKGVSWGRGRRAALRLDLFNLTNHANELEEDVLSGPAFRLSTVVQPPRTLRLGVRVDF